MKKVVEISVVEFNDLIGEENVKECLKGSGVYKVLFGSRGSVDEVEFFGDVEFVDYYDKEEVLKFMLDGCDDEEEMKEYVDEWYMVEYLNN